MNADAAWAIAEGLIKFWFIPVPILMLLVIFRNLIAR
jgi:hypothetical protein